MYHNCVWKVPYCVPIVDLTGYERLLIGSILITVQCWTMYCTLEHIPVSGLVYLSVPLTCSSGEHQMELLDCVAAKFHEEPGVFKLLVCKVPVTCNSIIVDL